MQNQPENETTNPAAPEPTAAQANGPRTLAIDIGGSGVKAIVLDADGAPVTDRAKLPTPKPAVPDAVLAVVSQLLNELTDFDRVSVGFPGVVRKGKTLTAHNLHPDWIGFDLQNALQKATDRPCRVANDADVQGYGVIAGDGVELVLTLGTGVGSALFVDGRLVPNLELAHHHYQDERTYEDYLGKAALDEIGKKKWNRRLQKVIDDLEATFNYDTLYLGGGNSKKIQLELPKNVRVVPNVAGLLGGIALWQFEQT